MSDRPERRFRRPSNSEMLYSNTDHARREELFGVQIGFLKAVGKVPHDLQRWLPLRIGTPLAIGYCTFVIGLQLHMLLLHMKTTYDMLQHGALDEISDALTTTIIYSFSTFAICYFLWRSRQLLSFLARINRQHWHHSLPGLSFVSSDYAYSVARRITIYWLVSCLSGVTLMGLLPLIKRVHVLPLNCWYPFDVLQPFVYELFYTFQLLAQITMGITFGSSSALYVSLVIILLGQFDALYCSLKNLTYYARLRAGEDLTALWREQQSLLMGQDDEVNQYEFAQEHLIDKSAVEELQQRLPPTTLEESLHIGMVQCVELHHFVRECCIELEHLFHPFCLVKSLQITLQLCLLVFVGVASDASLMRILSLMQYLALTLLELFMFTYCGELLRGHSVRCGEAFWRSQWWPHATVIRQDILIFLVNSQRAMRLTAGKFYAMDVERLRSVVAQAFSFLTLLQKLADKEPKASN